MPLVPVHCWRVVCDIPECTASTDDHSDTYAFATDRDAVDHAIDARWDIDWTSDPWGRVLQVLCPKHMRARCGQCWEHGDSFTVDGDGDRWCDDCLQSAGIDQQVTS